MHKISIIITLLVAISFLFGGCFGQSENVELQPNAGIEEVAEQEQEIEKSGVKVRINMNNGLLFYSYSPIREQPFIDSIDSFLNWYSDAELELVTRLVISNRNPANGEIRPLITTKGIERLPNLEYLKISSSGIERLEGHEELNKLERVELLSNNVHSISGIGHLEHLISLNLIGNPVVSLYEIEGSEYLESIALDRTLITTLDGIERFPNLLGISANGAPLEDVTALATLEHLQGAEFIPREATLNEESIAVLERMREANPDVYLYYGNSDD